MNYDPHALKIHVDGSARDNPGGPGGLAVVVEYPESFGREPEMVYSEGFEHTTNNRMELRACVAGLKWARDNVRRLGIRRVIIVTDSQYVHEQRKAAEFWKGNEWRNRAGRPMENPDLWREFLNVRGQVPCYTDMKWEKGKTTEISKLVDTSAKAARDGSGKTVDRRFRYGKIHRTKIARGSASLFIARNQEAVIRIYRKDHVGRERECKIRFDLYDDERGVYLSKHFAYVSPELENVLHGGHLYRVKFNGDRKYPHIETMIEEYLQDVVATGDPVNGRNELS